MRVLSHAALALTALAACGDQPLTIDARVDATVEPIDARGGEGCNPGSQTGCNPGETRCTWLHGANEALIETTCALDYGHIPIGEPCETVPGMWDDCVVGSVCRGGVCAPTCSGYTCGSGFCDFNTWICAPACDLFDDACAEYLACYPSHGPPDEGPGCVSAGTVPVGQLCSEWNECVPGSACIHQVCRSICDRAAVNPCGAGFSCESIEPDSPWGFCLPVS